MRAHLEGKAKKIYKKKNPEEEMGIGEPR
jgi:hypothetical protein